MTSMVNTTEHVDNVETPHSMNGNVGHVVMAIVNEAAMYETKVDQ